MTAVNAINLMLGRPLAASKHAIANIWRRPRHKNGPTQALPNIWKSAVGPSTDPRYWKHSIIKTKAHWNSIYVFEKHSTYVVTTQAHIEAWMKTWGCMWERINGHQYLMECNGGRGQGVSPFFILASRLFPLVSLSLLIHPIVTLLPSTSSPISDQLSLSL